MTLNKQLKGFSLYMMLIGQLVTKTYAIYGNRICISVSMNCATDS